MKTNIILILIIFTLSSYESSDLSLVQSLEDLEIIENRNIHDGRCDEQLRLFEGAFAARQMWALRCKSVIVKRKELACKLQ
jgi:hypothetical protein